MHKLIDTKAYETGTYLIANYIDNTAIIFMLFILNTLFKITDAGKPGDKTLKKISCR
jgi:hypothetical protein